MEMTADFQGSSGCTVTSSAEVGNNKSLLAFALSLRSVRSPEKGLSPE